jgi:hypothetical protein
MKISILDKWILIMKFRTLQQNVVGIRSDCTTGKHVFFLDLDMVNPRWLDSRIRHIQKKFSMGDIYLIQSSKSSYHLVELVPRTFGEVIDIQRAFDVQATKKFQIFSIVRGYWVLRCTEKVGKEPPKLMHVYAGDRSKAICKDHAKYIEFHFGYTIAWHEFKGERHKLKYDRFPTVKHKEKEEELVITKKTVEV